MKRFIEIEYSIPEPERGTFHKYLYSFFEFDDFLEKEARKKNRELLSDKKDFLKVSNILFSDSSINLRQQEKIFSHARLSLRSFTDNMYLIPEVFLFLIYIKVIHEKLYSDIVIKRLTTNELQNDFYAIIKNRLDEDNERIQIRMKNF